MLSKTIDVDGSGVFCRDGGTPGRGCACRKLNPGDGRDEP
jgi:hypothetical protein